MRGFVAFGSEGDGHLDVANAGIRGILWETLASPGTPMLWHLSGETGCLVETDLDLKVSIKRKKMYAPNCK